MNKIIITSILFLLASNLTGCATKDKGQIFQSTLRAYERVLRWGDIPKTNEFRKEPVLFTSADKKRFKSIKVTDYDTQQIEPDGELTMNVTVQIRYYNEEYMREKSIEDNQRWHYEKEKQLWYISSPMPKF